MITAKQVAEYLLRLSDPSEGDIVSHLKLQKLLYYVQGFYLALHDTSLFDEEICHWDHGPVVPVVYQHYKRYGQKALPLPNKEDAFVEPSAKEKEIIEEVNQVYGQFSAWKLRDMTHNEPPWVETHDNEVILHSQLKKYFKTQLRS